MSQTEFVYKYLKTHGSIDSRTALAHGIQRLAARINDLRNMGADIETSRKSVPTRWDDKKTYVAEYRLKKA